MRPVAGDNSPVIMRSNVVLPQPFAPIIATVCDVSKIAETDENKLSAPVWANDTFDKDMDFITSLMFINNYHHAPLAHVVKKTNYLYSHRCLL